MKLPTELFTDILLQVTDEEQFKNLCKASSSVRSVCSKKWFLEELLKNLMAHDEYICYRVDKEFYSVKKLFTNYNLQKIQDDTEKYIKKDLDKMFRYTDDDDKEYSKHNRDRAYETLYLYTSNSDVFYIINNLNKYDDFKIFIGELLGAIDDGKDIDSDMSELTI
jgi:hypothetical protein